MSYFFVQKSSASELAEQGSCELLVEIHSPWDGIKMLSLLARFQATLCTQGKYFTYYFLCFQPSFLFPRITADLAVTGISLYKCNLAEGDIGIPQPTHLFRDNLACLDDFQLCENVVLIVCHCLALLFDR